MPRIISVCTVQYFDTFPLIRINAFRKPVDRDRYVRIYHDSLSIHSSGCTCASLKLKCSYIQWFGGQFYYVFVSPLMCIFSRVLVDILFFTLILEVCLHGSVEIECFPGILENKNLLILSFLQKTWTVNFTMSCNLLSGLLFYIQAKAAESKQASCSNST